MVYLAARPDNMAHTNEVVFQIRPAPGIHPQFVYSGPIWNSVFPRIYSQE